MLWEARREHGRLEKSPACAFKDSRLLWTDHPSHHDINTAILAEEGEFVEREKYIKCNNNLETYLKNMPSYNEIIFLPSTKRDFTLELFLKDGKT